MRRNPLSVFRLLMLLAPAVLCQGQQLADPDFDTTVARPAYGKRRPTVLFDEGHANFHTSAGRYKPFADLIAADAYRVVPIKQRFSKKTLKKGRVLVISNALGPGVIKHREWTEEWLNTGAQPAFTEEECDAVRDWVRVGGSLLLIADHRPFGSAARNLSSRFGVEMSNGYAWDKRNSPEDMNNPGVIVATREAGTLTDHPVTRGRAATEQVNRVIVFVGQSLKGPLTSVAFLKLAPTAVDRESLLHSAKVVSAAGRAQGLAIRIGKGRVVVLAEAAMVSAQLDVRPKRTIKMGMNAPGTDNRQLCLNIMHWLSRLLD